MSASNGATVADRLARVRMRIEQAARAAGRDPAGITLVAVSATKTPEQVREAFLAGQRAFGENYAQELAIKAEALRDLQGIEWHFVGHVQTNKAKIVAKYADVIHAVDSAAVAREPEKRAVREGRPRRVPVLIEVNVGHEPQKAGAAPSDIEEVVAAVREQEALALAGMMTMPPFGDLREARKCFETLVSLRQFHGGAAALPELSMGMSEDRGRRCVRRNPSSAWERYLRFAGEGRLSRPSGGLRTERERRFRPRPDPRPARPGTPLRVVAPSPCCVARRSTPPVVTSSQTPVPTSATPAPPRTHPRVETVTASLLLLQAS